MATDFKTVTINHSDTPPHVSSKRRRALSFFHAQAATKIGLRSLFEGFILDCKVTGKSNRTIEYYSEKLSKFLWYSENYHFPKHIHQIEASHIREFLAYIRNTPNQRWNISKGRANHPASPSTVKRFYSCLRVMFNWGISEGYIKESPLATIKPPKDAKHVVKSLTAEQVGKCISLLEGNKFVSIRNRAMFLVIVDTAIRLGELLNLAPQNVDLERQVLIVNGKTGERYVRFGNLTAKTLWKYLNIRNRVDGQIGALWLSRTGDALTPRGVDGIFRALGKQLGIHIHPHLLRHTGATLFLKNVGSPFECQYLLGHQSLEMTKRYCQSLGFDDAYNAHIKASPVDNLRKQKGY